MARFYATVEGDRGTATKASARTISAHVRGWDVGVEVHGVRDHDDDSDTFSIFATSGSHGGRSFKIGDVRIVDGKPIFDTSDAMESVR